MYSLYRHDILRNSPSDSRLFVAQPAKKIGGWSTLLLSPHTASSIKCHLSFSSGGASSAITTPA
eukprot:1196300-Prorocentrum_minimum.AAC.4